MTSQMPQTNLLKQYIKTFHASRPVFPGVLPRKWGEQFSDAELQQIYTALTLVIKQADAYSRENLIREFESFAYSPQHLRWYLDRFWNEIVDLLIDVPKSANNYQLN
ncbi:hypothetical protein GCM10028805_14830 [Spirosoma harenae]